MAISTEEVIKSGTNARNHPLSQRLIELLKDAPGILEMAAFYGDMREMFHPEWALQKPPNLLILEMDGLLASFGLKFGINNHLRGASRTSILNLYQRVGLLPRWRDLSGHIRDGAAAWHYDDGVWDVRFKGGGQTDIELWVWESEEFEFKWGISSTVIDSRGLQDEASLYESQDYFDSADEAFENLKKTYKKIQEFSSGKHTMPQRHTADLKEKPKPLKPKPPKKPSWREALGPSKKQRRAAAIRVSDRDILVQAAEFGDVPAIAAYTPMISGLVKKGYLKASTAEPGAYVITPAGRKMLPEGNPNTPKYKVRTTGTFFSLETGEMPVKQTVTVDARTMDEARKKAASKMSDRAVAMGYEYDGSHRSFKAERMNTRKKTKKKAKKNPESTGGFSGMGGRSPGGSHKKLSRPKLGKGFRYISEGPGIFFYEYKADPAYEISLYPLEKTRPIWHDPKRAPSKWYGAISVGPETLAHLHGDTTAKLFSDALMVIEHHKKHGSGFVPVEDDQAYWKESLGEEWVLPPGRNPKKAKKKAKKKASRRKKNPMKEWDQIYGWTVDRVDKYDSGEITEVGLWIDMPDTRYYLSVDRGSEWAPGAGTTFTVSLAKMHKGSVAFENLPTKGDWEANVKAATKWANNILKSGPVETASERGASKSKADVAAALKFINRHRAKDGMQGPLDPKASRWLDKEVTDEAKRLGWKPNPPKKKVTKKAASPAKALIDKCQKAWKHYCERPGRKRLKEVFTHLEKMEKSSAKTVKAELRRCKRSAKAEAKRLGMEV